MKIDPKNLANKKTKLSPRIWAMVGIGIIVVVIILSVLFRSNKEDRQIFFSMDTTVTIKSWGGHSGEYKKIVQTLDEKFDKTDENSDIFKLNQDGEINPSDYTVEILKRCKAFCESNPEIDITSGELIDLWKVNSGGNIPSDVEISNALEKISIKNLEIDQEKVSLKCGKIDLGCVAKGYACDVLKKEFEKKHEECAIASFGSSSVLYGEKSDGEAFSVGVTNPDDKDENIGILKLSECFVSTSGGYERFFEADGKKYSHIMDLENGRPVETDILSVTVIGDSGWYTDMLSTLIYIKGTACFEEYFGLDSIKLVIVDNEKNVHISKALEECFELKSDEYKVVVHNEQ